MWTFVIISGVLLILFAIYFMNIGLVRVQLEELTHRFERGDNLSGDLEEWEYYLNRLFWKPLGTKNMIMTYGAHFQDFLEANYPNHDSRVLEKYKKLAEKQNN